VDHRHETGVRQCRRAERRQHEAGAARRHPPGLDAARLSRQLLGEAVSTYYTLAWFDRYLKGRTDPRAARDGYRRLTANFFDDSNDRHNISQGVFDPLLVEQAQDAYGGYRPYLLAGLPVRDQLADRLSAR
jgi:hypothetical protein